MSEKVQLEQLTIVRCNDAQIEQTLRNHWPHWGEPRGFTIEKYLERGERLRADQSFSKDGAHVTWALVDRRNPDVLLSHCETFRRPALILPPGEKEPRDGTTYTIAAVFCPGSNRGKGYARHMLRLMHYVVGAPSGLPPFPKAWGAPPAETLGDAKFSVLYSGIGDKFYADCRVGDGADSTAGWVEQRQDTRTWAVQPGGVVENNGLWEWLGHKDTVKLAQEVGKRFKKDLPNQGDASKTRVAILPDSTVDYQIFRFLVMWPEHPSPRFGCILPPDQNGRRPFFLYSAVGTPDKPPTLEIMIAEQPIPWEAVRAAAVHHGADKIKMWSDFTGWDNEEGGVKVERNEDCPSLASYGLGEVDWQFNDKLRVSMSDEQRQHLKWTHGDFEVISSDNVRFCVPTYLLQAVSSVFRDMIESGSGEKRIHLDGSSAVITEVLRIANSCILSFGQPDSISERSEIVGLIHFVQKYDCEAVRNFLLLFAEAPCEDNFDQILARLLILMHMDDKRMCAAFIDRHPGSFGWVNASALSDSQPLNYRLFALIPQRYHWVMSMGNVGNSNKLPLDYSNQHRQDRISPGRRFLYYMVMAEGGSNAVTGYASADEED